MQKLPIKKLVRYLSPLIIVATLLVFILFFIKHPTLRQALAETDKRVLLIVFGLYGMLILCLTWVYDVTLRLCGKRISHRENILLTSYSSIANFFGPLQSGPGVRAVYLKKRHDVAIKDYGVASLLYYAVYATISALFLLLSSGRYWPLGILATLLVAIGSFGIVQLARKRAARRSNSFSVRLTPALVLELIAATLVQLIIVAAIYFVELHAVHAQASVRQAIAYGGAANFALFVSITPGAIGFREAFLAFSQNIHHIGTNIIVAANIIDRAVYVVFLGALFLVILALHADKRFRQSDQAVNEPQPSDDR